MIRRKLLFLSLALLALASGAKAQDYAVLKDGLIKDIKPQGWLLEFLQRQKTGLTGHPEAMDYPYNTCLWAGEIERKANEATAAKEWWRYEQTAYYTDGLLRLGYLLNDADLINKGESGVNYTIANAAANGRLGNAKLESLWPMAVFFRAMLVDYQFNGNSSIPTALEKNYLSLTLNDLAVGHRHIINLEGLLWTYGITKNAALLSLAEEAYNKGGFDLDATAAGNDNYINLHGVTYAEMLKIPLLLYAYTGKTSYLDIAMNAERKLERDHMLPDGVYTSAEYTSGRDIDIAHETCDITDYTWSLGYFLDVTGEAEWADRIEKAVFNAGLGAITKDFRSLQYFSSPNQVICTGTSDNNAFKRGLTWMAYRPVHETECCVGNVNRFMPNYAARMWMRGKENSVVATLYGPSEFSFNADGADCKVAEDTKYPFDGTVTFTFSMSQTKSFPFTLRVPGWCKSASLTINGKAYDGELTAGKFVTINRSFADGDKIVAKFDMPVEVCDVPGQGKCVQRGPLLFSYAVPESKVEDLTVYSNMNGKASGNADFKCWSITPTGAFNYAVDTTGGFKEKVKVTVDEAKLNSGYPFDLDNAPIKITLPVDEIGWGLEGGKMNPNLPKTENIVTTGKKDVIELVPYGCTELRMTVFPVAPTVKKNDFTDLLLVNPDFEIYQGELNTGGTQRKGEVPEGWTVTGTLGSGSYGINSDATVKHGDNICWFRLLPFPEDFELSQTIPAAKLEPGTYKVSCKLWNQYNQKGNCRFFANKNVQYLGCKDEYVNNMTEGESATFAGYSGGDSNINPKFVLNDMAVYVTVAQGEDLKIGLRSNGIKSDGTRATGSDATGWFKVDDFRIEKVEKIPADNGNDDTELTAQLLVNPDFEFYKDGDEVIENTTGTARRYTDYGGIYGWNLNCNFLGTSYGISNDGLNKHGNNVCWFNNTQEAMPNNFELSQTISADKLTPGRYLVKCRLWVQSGQLGKCRLFANNNVQYYGAATDYLRNLTEGENNDFAGLAGGEANKYIMQDMQVYVDVAEGEPLKLGLRSGSQKSDGSLLTATAPSGWFKCDYFTIKKVGDAVQTGIRDIAYRPKAVLHSIYTINGQLISCDSNATTALPKGVYIIDGSKILIK